MSLLPEFIAMLVGPTLVFMASVLFVIANESRR